VATSTDYCHKVTARAEADSALLFAPTATVQVVRYPQNAIADSVGVNVGQGFQPRATLGIGIVDIYKGFAVRDVAEKDCARQETTVALQEVVLQRDDGARKVALERKLAYLREQQPKVEAVIRAAEARFAAGTATLLEVHELRRRALDFVTKTADTERLLQTLKAREIAAPHEPVDALLTRYGFFARDTIPVDAYPGVPATPTIAVGAQWLVSDGLGADLVHGLATALWHPSARERLDAGHPKGASIRLETALSGVTVPLHPGAERFYRERGLLP
jgi:hypothetical protein